MKRILFLILFTAAVISCNKDKETTPANFQLGTETNFRLGGAYLSNVQPLQFKISEINDSRCPSDVVCIWQGEAIVTIDVESPVVGYLRLSTFDNQKDTLDSYSFELVDVAPYPVSNSTIKLEDYEIRLKIEKVE